MRELAERMGGDVDVNELTLLLHIHNTGGHECWMGQETAEGLARAFGTSAELWLNLDDSYRRAMTGMPPRHKA